MIEKFPKDIIFEIQNYLSNKDITNLKCCCKILNKNIILTKKILENINWTYVACSYDLHERFMFEYRRYMRWDILLKYQYMSEEFIEKMISEELKLKEGRHYIYFGDLIENKKLSMKFIKKYKNIIDRYHLLIVLLDNQDLDEDFVREYDGCISSILTSQNLSEKFLEKYTREHLMEIITTQKLSEKFLIKYAVPYLSAYLLLDKYILKYQKVSKEFIEKYITRADNNIIYAFIYQDYDIIPYGHNIKALDWEKISTKPLPIKFIEKYSKYIKWERLPYSNGKLMMNKKFMKKYIDKFDLKVLLNRKLLPLDFIYKISKKLDEEDILKIIQNFTLTSYNIEQLIDVTKASETIWEHICFFVILTGHFLDKYMDYINKYSAVVHNLLLFSKDHIIKYGKIYGIENVVKNTLMNEDMLEYFIEEIDKKGLWRTIFYSQALTQNFMIKYIDNFIEYILENRHYEHVQYYGPELLKILQQKMDEEDFKKIFSNYMGF